MVEASSYFPSTTIVSPGWYCLPIARARDLDERIGENVTKDACTQVNSPTIMRARAQLARRASFRRSRKQFQTAPRKTENAAPSTGPRKAPRATGGGEKK